MPISEDELPEVIISSSTQSPEFIKKFLEDKGYEISEDETQSDQPADDRPATEGQQPSAGKSEPAAGDAPAGDDKSDADDADADQPTPQEKQQQESEEKDRLSRRQRAKARRDAEFADLKSQNEKVLRELEELRTSKPAPVQEPAKKDPVVVEQPAVAAKPKPSPDDFEQGALDPAYVEAVTDWKFDERERLRDESRRNADQQIETEKRRKADAELQTVREASEKSDVERWKASYTKGRSMFDDFDQAMSSAPPVQIPPLLVTAVKDRESGAQLAYLLQTRPEDARRIVGLVKLPDKPTDAEVRRVYARLDRELDKLEELLPKGDDAPAGDDIDDVDDPPAAKPPAKTAVSAPAAPAKPKPAPAAKPAPPPIVGGRGTPAARRITDLIRDDDKSREVLRDMDPDDYRRAIEKVRA